MRSNLFVLVFSIGLSACDSCISNFYKVYERQKPLKIGFSTPNVAALNLQIDSINRINHCDVQTMLMERQDRLIFLDHCLALLANFNDNGFTIVAIFSLQTGVNFWGYKGGAA